jgi:hypothetical protein
LQSKFFPHFKIGHSNILILRHIRHDFLDELKTIHATINNIRCPTDITTMAFVYIASIQETGKASAKEGKHKQ